MSQQKPEQDEEEQQKPEQHEEGQQKLEQDEEEQEKPEQNKEEQEKQNQNHTGMLQAPLVIAKFLTSYIDMRFVLYHLPINLSVKLL